MHKLFRKQYILSVIAHGNDYMIGSFFENKYTDVHEDGYPAVLFGLIIKDRKIEDYEKILSEITQDGYIKLENRNQQYGLYYHLTESGTKFYDEGGYLKGKVFDRIWYWITVRKPIFKFVKGAGSPARQYIDNKASKDRAKFFLIALIPAVYYFLEIIKTICHYVPCAKYLVLHLIHII
jgi:hypothetical protein